ncbi:MULTISPECIES: hypothetical protein [Providencia]|uniref:hypothetical protein n=1 Tax=Providencia TaxID=586 RepID=UPI001B387F81|nr:hypothetical protein [Providencia rettgeri]ELY3855364.1 hypothetical protein [Providencia rettgeri]MBQ0366065.1 hypothetical protein [Providencia rettgeri]
MITTIIYLILILIGGIYSSYQATRWLLMLWDRLRYKRSFKSQLLKKAAIKLMDAGKKVTGVKADQVTIYYDDSQSHTFLSENAAQQVRCILQFHQGLDEESRRTLEATIDNIRNKSPEQSQYEKVVDY